MQLMMTPERDPFANTANPDAYVPRTATESALLGLEMALRDGARVVCLNGPTGSGKTLLLRVLEERLAGDFASMRVPYPKLDPEEFCLWALSAFGHTARGEPEQELAQRIARRAGAGDPPLVWMIDDADLLPSATLHVLLRLQRSTGDAMRLVLSRSGELPADEFAQAGVMPVRVEIEGEMDREEMKNYVHARLVHSGADPAQRAKIEAELDRLWARSRGNPGRLHTEAAELLCFGPERLAAPFEDEEEHELPAPAPSIERVDGEQTARDYSARAEEERADEPVAAAKRVSIESIVAEAVAAEPLEEVALVEPTTVLVASRAAAEPSRAETSPDEPVPAPEGEGGAPDGGPPRPPPRKRHRLRRLGRR